MYLDNDEIKFIILHTLALYETPISRDKLMAMLSFDSDILDYFTATQRLGELIEDDFIENVFSTKEKTYALTKFGEESAELFKARIPNSIKNKIEKIVSNAKYEVLIESDLVDAKVIVVDTDKYAVSLLLQKSTICMIEMCLYVGDKITAEDIVKRFRQNPELVYGDIFRGIKGGA